MMTAKFKRSVSAVAGLMIGASLLVPSAAIFAQTDATSAPNLIKPTPKTYSCSIFTDKEAKVIQKAADNQSKLDQKRADQLNKISGNRLNNDKKLADSRLNADQKRAEQIAKLQGRASTTDAQKAAIAAFQTAVANAVTARRAAIDSAISTFRAAHDQALAARKASVDQATAAYKADVQAAYEKASSSCQIGTAKKAVQATLKADLKAARIKFNNNRQSIEKFSVAVNSLVKIRQKAVADAVTAFQTAVNQARATLKAAFPKKK